MENIEALEHEGIGKLLRRLSIPSIAGMLVQSLYNIVDAFFVGRSVGPHGIAAVSVAFPFQITVMAVALMLGIGGVSLMSASLGERNSERAERIFGTVVSVSLLWGVFVAFVNVFFADAFVRLLGASEDIAPAAARYVRIVAVGVPFFSCSIVGNNAARSEGNARLAMCTTLISGLMNCLLDPLFIFVFELGVAGAAWATVLSQALGALWLAAYHFGGKSVIRLRARYLRPDASLLGRVVSVGFSAFARQFGLAFTIGVLNNIFVHYGGPMALAAYGIIQRVYAIAILLLQGIVEGLLPIVGYNWGAKNYGRVDEALWLSSVAGTGVCVLDAILLVFFPEPLFAAFSDDPRLLEAGVTGARIIGSGIALVGFQFVVSGFYQGIGRGGPALCFSALRQIVLLPPLIYMLASRFGIHGAWWAFPAADSIALTIASAWFYWDKRRGFLRKE
jgi:putative MATE family efflux protein